MLASADRPRILPTRWKPFLRQRAVLARDEGIDLVVGGIGSGKSQVAAHKILRWALEHPRRPDGRPTVWLVLAPGLGFLRQEQFELVLGHAGQLSVGGEAIVRRVVAGGTNPRIVLAHGQVILGRSGTEPRRLRGLEVDGAWVDEAEYQQEEAFTQAIARQRGSRVEPLGVRCLVTTTPRAVRASWVWSLLTGKPYEKLRATGVVRLHRWRSSDNPTLAPETLGVVAAAIEAGGGENAVATELDGLFAGSFEAPDVSAFDVSRSFPPRVQLGPSASRVAVIGVDLGRSQDFTVFASMGEEGHVLRLDRFNVSTLPFVPRDDFYAYTESRLVQLVGETRAPLVKLDTAMSGEAFASGLRRALNGRARVDGYRTDSVRRKAEAFESLGVALSRGQVLVPRSWVAPDGREHRLDFVEELKRELADLVVEDRRAGYRTFDHPQGGHDDLLVALALAWQGLTTSGVVTSDCSGFGALPAPAAFDLGGFGDPGL